MKTYLVFNHKEKIRKIFALACLNKDYDVKLGQKRKNRFGKTKMVTV